MMEFIFALCVCGTIIAIGLKLLQGALWLFDVTVKPEPRVTRPAMVAPEKPASYEEQLSWSCTEGEIREMRRRHPERFKNAN